jgi:hypothetical protein
MVPATVRLNRMPVASIAVLALAGVAFVVSSGGLGVADAARAVPGSVGGSASQPGSLAVEIS